MSINKLPRVIPRNTHVIGITARRGQQGALAAEASLALSSLLLGFEQLSASLGPLSFALLGMSLLPLIIFFVARLKGSGESNGRRVMEDRAVNNGSQRTASPVIGGVSFTGKGACPERIICLPVEDQPASVVDGVLSPNSRQRWGDGMWAVVNEGNEFSSMKEIVIDHRGVNLREMNLAMPAAVQVRGNALIARNGREFYLVNDTESFAGGTADVLKVSDDKGKPHALKVVKPGVDPARILREISILRSIHHPQVVCLEAQVDYEGREGYVIPWLEQDIIERFLDQETSVVIVLGVIIDLVQTLDQLFTEKSLVHRDLKSSNIRVAEDGKWYLTDFSSAKTIKPPERDEGATINMEVTGKGSLTGTPNYLDPIFLLDGEGINPVWPDIFSLAHLLHLLLFRERLYVVQGNGFEALARIDNQWRSALQFWRWVSKNGDDILKSIAQILLKMTEDAKAVEDKPQEDVRYASYAALKTDLVSLLDKIQFDADLSQQYAALKAAFPGNN